MNNFQNLTDEQSIKENSIVLSYVGDLILLRDQVITAFDEKKGKYDFDKVFEHAKPYLQSSDLSIGVFEGPATGDQAGYSTSNYGDGIPLRLNFPDEFAQAVKDSGINLVTTANNHLLDCGVDGAMRTLDVLDKVGLMHTGSYRNQEEKDRLFLVDVKGIKIAVLAYLKGVNNWNAQKLTTEVPHLTSIMPDQGNPNCEQLMNEIEDDFAQARQSGADLIMVMAHMGTQFTTTTDAFQDKWNKLFVRLGADIILGDHAHAVQPIEYIGNTLVVNCPGNFANSYIKHNGDATAIVEIYIDKDTKRVAASSVIPMYTHEMKKGYFRALPIYSVMNDQTLYQEVGEQGIARMEQVHTLVTDVMLKKAVGLKDIQERYFLCNNPFPKNKRTLLKSSHAYADSELYCQIQKANSITFIGDSITEGTKNGFHPWYELLMEDFGEKKITNISKGSYTTKRILSDFEKEILDSHSDLYIVAIGTNDVRYRSARICAMTPSEYVEQLDRISRLMKSSNKDARIFYIAPWTTLENDKVSKLAHQEKCDLIDAYAEKLEEYAADNNFGFVNANPYLRTFFKGCTSKLYTADGIHPNHPAGVELYAKAVLESSVLHTAKKQLHSSEGRLFVADKGRMKKICEANYRLEGAARIDEIEEGIILPLRRRDDLTNTAFEGGVCDKNGDFITGSCRKLGNVDFPLSAMRGYQLQEPPKRRHETVVFGGLITWHFGTQLCDGLARVWWFADHPDTTLKIVFLKAPRQIWDSPHSSRNITTILEAMGITEDRMEIITEPTQFDKIIVPQESFHMWSGYRPEWLKSYDLIRSKVKEGPYKRIYLSRTAYVKSTDLDGINEEYFEDFYRRRGYEIIHPEQLDFMDQISILAGAEDVVCISGSLVHVIAFCKPRTKITILRRSPSMWSAWMYALREREFDYTFIDAHFDFLPSAMDGQNIYLYGPTSYWKDYLDQSGIAYEPDEVSIEKHVAPHVYTYLCKWAKIYAEKGQYKRVVNTTLADILTNLNDMLLQTKIDKAAYPDRSDVTKLKREKNALAKQLVEQQAANAQTRNQSLVNELESYKLKSAQQDAEIACLRDGLNAVVTAKEQITAQLREELESWKIKAAQLESESVYLKAENQKTKNELAVQKKANRQVRKKLELWQNKVHGMEASLSWRITKPLRKIKSFFKRILGR